MSTASPLSDSLVTVFGGGGFIGNYVAQALLARGARVRIACRHPQAAWPLKPLANLGQIQFAHCDITNPDSLAASLHGATHVVNLVGDFAGDLGELMGEAPGRMAAIAKAMASGPSSQCQCQELLSRSLRTWTKATARTYSPARARAFVRPEDDLMRMMCRSLAGQNLHSTTSSWSWRAPSRKLFRK